MKDLLLPSAVLILVMLMPVSGVAAPATPSRSVALSTDTATQVPGSPLLWYDASNLRLEGKGWADTETTYHRLPPKAKGVVTTPVWERAAYPAGLCVRFVTDSPGITAMWDGSAGFTMNHMAPTGSAGLDLYERRGQDWVYRGTGMPEQTTTTCVLASDLPSSPTEYMLYLPLYHKLAELKLGVTSNSTIAPAGPRPRGKDRPIVFYGTSITQGGCASRAGMCHVAMLGRWLDRECINLGFSGSGKMELEFAPLLADIDAEVFVLECLPNMEKEMVDARVEPFVRILREKHPEMPILLVENPLLRRDAPMNVSLQGIYQKLKDSGVKKLWLLPADKQLAGRENGTVDRIHPTDLGFTRMAEVYLPVMQEILGTPQ